MYARSKCRGGPPWPPDAGHFLCYLLVRLFYSKRTGPVMGRISLADFPGIDADGDRNQYLEKY